MRISKDSRIAGVGSVVTASCRFGPLLGPGQRFLEPFPACTMVRTASGSRPLAARLGPIPADPTGVAPVGPTAPSRRTRADRYRPATGPPTDRLLPSRPMVPAIGPAVGARRTGRAGGAFGIVGRSGRDVSVFPAHFFENPQVIASDDFQDDPIPHRSEGRQGHRADCMDGNSWRVTGRRHPAPATSPSETGRDRAEPAPTRSSIPRRPANPGPILARPIPQGRP